MFEKINKGKFNAMFDKLWLNYKRIKNCNSCAHMKYQEAEPLWDIISCDIPCAECVNHSNFKSKEVNDV